jgi:K319-like protein
MKQFSPLPGLLAFSMLIFAGCQKNTVPKEPPPPRVYAGPDQTIALPTDTVRLTGRATDSSSRITAYLWSEVSGPNVPVIASEGSLSTQVTGLVAGTYIFQLMAVDSIGHTGVDTVSIFVNNLPATLVLNTGTPPYELTFLANPQSPQGGSGGIELLAEAWTIESVPVFGRSFFKFDMTRIPSGTTVKSAQLTLFSDPKPINGDLIHANYGTSNDFFIQRVSGNWNLTGTNWNNLPSLDTTGQVHIPQTSQPFLDLVNVDVTAMVNKMIVSGNNGFAIRLNNETTYNSRIFCSSNYSDSTKHPYLVVTY